MTWPKVFLIMAALSLGGAGLVAYVSRTPAEIREAKPGPEAQDPALGATFTDEQVERHAAYRGPGYLSFVITTALPILLLVLLSRGPFGQLVEKLENVRGGWPVRVVLAALVVAGLTTLLVLPFSFVRGFSVAKDWGLSTQSLGGWISDHAKSLGIGTVLAAISALAFYGVVRAAPKTWWLWGWAAFTTLTVLMVFLYPVVIAPLFNKFTSLDEGPLRTQIIELGEQAGVPLDDVLVADASKRTTAENAYVAGLGSTKRMVLYDTLLNNGREDETLFVVAHELGHKKENHVLKNVIISSGGLLVGFGLLYLLTRREGFLSWAGATDVKDLRALPLLLLYLTVASLLTMPIENAISRNFERRADEIAIELTGNPEPGLRAFRRLAFSNIAELEPHPVAVWALFSHPPIPDRLEALFQEARRLQMDLP